MEIIDWDQNASWEQQVTLDNKLFTIACSYNGRAGAWFISVYDLDKNPLVLGKRLTLNTNVFNYVTNEKTPNGVLVMLAVAEGKEIARDNVGSEVVLAFLGYDEVF